MNNILARSIRCKSLLNKRFIHISPGVMNAKVAVVLSGCGVYDGTEVHEASACLVHLSRAGAKVLMYAPNIDQMHTIDHTRGEEMEPNRSVLCESARIARGEVASLTELKSSEFDAVIIPGGFGAAKNLCSWAVDNVSCKVNDEVKRVIQEFQESGKPIGLSCIAPVLAAKCIPGVEVTVGHATDEGGMWPYAGTAGAMEQCGAKHVQKEVTEAHTDVTKKVVTTPAFMCNAPVHKVYDGIGEMISGTLKLVKQ